MLRCGEEVLLQGAQRVREAGRLGLHTDTLSEWRQADKAAKASAPVWVPVRVRVALGRPGPMSPPEMPQGRSHGARLMPQGKRRAGGHLSPLPPASRGLLVVLLSGLRVSAAAAAEPPSRQQPGIMLVQTTTAMGRVRMRLTDKNVTSVIAMMKAEEGYQVAP